MKKIQLLSLMLIINLTIIAQTYSEIENEIKRGALLLASPETDVNEIISSKNEYEFDRDEIINGQYYKSYYYKPLGSLIFLQFDERSWYSYGKVCVKVMHSFYYPTSQLKSMTDYISQRSIFKNIKDYYYYLLVSTNPYFNGMKDQGYKIIINIEEKKLEKSSSKNKFQLTCNIMYIKA
jgi:hypothetical protein